MSPLVLSPKCERIATLPVAETGAGRGACGIVRMPMQRRPAARVVRTTKPAQLARLQSPDSASELSDPMRIKAGAGVAAESQSRRSCVAVSSVDCARFWRR